MDGRVFHRTCFVLMLMCTALCSWARISVNINDRAYDPARLQIRWTFDSSKDHSFGRWLQVKDGLRPFTEENLSMSYRQGQFWISVDLSQLPMQEHEVFLEIHNPHINYLGAWLMKGDSLVQAFTLTGDHEPFKARQVDHSYFAYKINHDRKGLRLVLMVDKRNEQLHLPLSFYSPQKFVVEQRNNNLVAGLYIGITVFILLFTLFLYFNIREKLYIYYAFYVLMVGGYIFSDLGLSFMLLYPNKASLADFARPLTISLAPVFYILFSRTLLRVKEHFPKLYRFTNWHLYFFAVCFALGFGIPNEGALRAFWLVLMQVIMVTSIIPVFIFSIAGLKRGVPYSGYIVVASLLFTLFSQVYMQYITGNLPENHFTRNAFNIGFTAEIILLTLALSIRFKNYKLEAEELLIEFNKQQENIFRNISAYQEKEMTRLSGLLHDTIGASLSSIKFNLEAVDNHSIHNKLLKTTIEDVTNLTDEIRNISHNLSPLMLQQKGLLRALQEMIDRYNRTSRVRIWLESIGSQQSASFQNEILVFRIIQELLQNAVKHSCATEIIIQLIIEPGLISILVEDNGRGLEPSGVKEGLGFSQIKALVTFVQGQFTVKGEPNKGCAVSIEFPTIQNESSNKSIAGRRSSYVS